MPTQHGTILPFLENQEVVPLYLDLMLSSPPWHRPEAERDSLPFSQVHGQKDGHLSHNGPPPRDPLCPSHCAVIDAGLCTWLNTPPPRPLPVTGCSLQPFAELSQSAQ